MAALYQRGSVWWARIQIAGRVHRFTTGLRDRKKAKEFLSLLNRFSTGIEDRERAGRLLRTLIPMLHECRRLGLRVNPARGLLILAKEIESAWIRLERLLAKMRDRGFLGT